MKKFHINNNGVITECNATNNCPFGDSFEDHYLTINEAIVYGGLKIAKIPENIALQNKFLMSIGDSTVNKNRLEHMLIKVSPQTLDLPNISEKRSYIENLDFTKKENTYEALRIAHGFGESLYNLIEKDSKIIRAQKDLDDYYNGGVLDPKLLEILTIAK